MKKSKLSRARTTCDPDNDILIRGPEIFDHMGSLEVIYTDNSALCCIKGLRGKCQGTRRLRQPECQRIMHELVEIVLCMTLSLSLLLNTLSILLIDKTRLNASRLLSTLTIIVTTAEFACNQVTSLLQW